VTELLPAELETGAEKLDVSGDHVCPECGQTFKLAMHLGAHRARKHGVAAATPKRKRSGAKSESASSPRARRKTAIASTLRELADLADDARGRGTELPEDLAAVIRRDADKIATTLAAVADKLNPVGWFVDATMGPGGVLTLAVGLSGVGRWLLRQWRAQLTSRGEQQPVEPTAAYCGIEGCEIVHPHEHRPEGVIYL
jgi:hypothetical protein